MKNCTIFIVALLLSAYSYSQTLPNMDFDNWTSFSGGAYEEPSGGVWTTANKSTLLTSLIPVTTEKTTDAISGTYAAKMSTKWATLIPPLLVTGTLATGTFNELAVPPANLKLGTPFIGRPLKFKGYYKYTDNNGDSCSIYAILSKWDGTARQSVGEARLTSTLTVTTYTLFDLDFTYYSADIPDSVSVVFASSAAGAQMQGNAGAALYIDNTSFEYNNGYETFLNPAIEVNCFPIPATSEINFQLSKELTDGTIKIYSEAGAEVLSVKVNSATRTIMVDGLTSGNYFFKILDKNITLNAGKFIIE